MSLMTGRRLHSNQYAELPVDDLVIARVEELARKQKQPLMAGGDPLFEWTPDQNILPHPTNTLDDDGNTPLVDAYDDYDSEDDEDYYSDDDEPPTNEDLDLDHVNYDMGDILPEAAALPPGQPIAANQGAPHLQNNTMRHIQTKERQMRHT